MNRLSDASRIWQSGTGTPFWVIGSWHRMPPKKRFSQLILELPSLHESKAFAGWFRRIVVKQIDRIRRKRRAVIALDQVSHFASEQQSPSELFEHHERYAAILTATQALPVRQREVVTLFYIGAYSYNDIGVFLDIPVSTVKMRLYHARKVLQHQLVSILKEELPRQRPSRNATFMERIMNYQITTKVVPAQQIISVTRDCFISDLQAHLDGGIKTLTVYAQHNVCRRRGYRWLSTTVQSVKISMLPWKSVCPLLAQFKRPSKLP